MKKAAAVAADYDNGQKNSIPHSTVKGAIPQHITPRYPSYKVDNSKEPDFDTCKIRHAELRSRNMKTHK